MQIVHRSVCSISVTAFRLTGWSLMLRTVTTPALIFSCGLYVSSASSGGTFCFFRDLPDLFVPEVVFLFVDTLLVVGLVEAVLVEAVMRNTSLHEIPLLKVIFGVVFDRPHLYSPSSHI
jgi:hypothetical protein